MAFATSSAVLGVVADFSTFVEKLYNLYNRHQKYRSYLERLVTAVNLALPSIRKLHNPHCRVPAEFVDVLKQDIYRGIELLTEIGEASAIKLHWWRITDLNSRIEEVYNSLTFHMDFLVPVLVTNVGDLLQEVEKIKDDTGEIKATCSEVKVDTTQLVANSAVLLAMAAENAEVSKKTKLECEKISRMMKKFMVAQGGKYVDELEYEDMGVDE